MAEKVLGFKINIEGLAGTIETATELKRAIASLNEELKKTSDVDEIKKLEKQMIDLKAAQMEVTKITREQVKLRNEEITATDKANGAYRRLSKELNDARNRYKDLAVSEQDSSEEALQLLDSIRKLDTQLKSVDARVGQFQRNVGGYTESLSQFFPRLGGQLGNITGAIGGITSGFQALGKTTGAVNVSLGAIGIALTAFSAISEIFAGINETVAETKKLSAQVQNFTQATGSTLESFVAQSKAIATTYTKDVNEIVVAANTASKELGVSFPEALDAIEIGFRKGADAQGEFLDSLREYPSQLGQAGFTLKEFTAIAIDAANQGVYSDKAIDAIKEFGVQTREQTKSVKDAFVDALGSDFTNKLFLDLNTNAISGRDALALVTKEIKTTGVSGKELQGLISTVFVGAGEDAGRYVLSLGDVLNKTDQIILSTNEYQTQQELLYKSNLALEESQADLNDILIKTSGEFTLISNAAKIFFNNVLSGLADLVNEFPATFKAISAGFKTFFATGDLKTALLANRIVFRKEIDIIKKEDTKALEEQSKNEIIIRTKTQGGIEKQLSELRLKRKSLIFGSEDYKKVDIEIKKLEKELQKFNPKETGRKGGKEIVEAFVNGSLAKLQEDQSKLQKAFGEAVVGSDAQKAIAVQLTAANEAVKKAVDKQNELLGLNAEKKKQDAINEINQNSTLAKSFLELARAKDNTYRNELDTIANRRKIIDEDYNLEKDRINKLLALEKEGTPEFINLTNEKIKSETNYLNQIKALSNDEIDLYRKNFDEVEKLNKENIEKENQAKEELRKIDQKKIDEKKENTKKLIDSITDSILSITDIISAFQNKKNQEAIDINQKQIEATEQSIEELEAKAEKSSGLRKKRIERDIAAQKELLKQQNAEAEALRIKNAKEEKRIAIIQAIIQGALAVSRALSSSPPPLNFINAAAVGLATGAQIATISAQPLAQGGLVTGERVTQKQNIPTRSNGDNVLAFVKRGEVVLNQRQQSLLGGSETFRRIGIKGFAQGGLVPPISAPISATQVTNDATAFIKVIDAKTDAINARIDRLQAYVVSDDIARDLQEGNKLKINATL